MFPAVTGCMMKKNRYELNQQKRRGKQVFLTIIIQPGKPGYVQPAWPRKVRNRRGVTSRHSLLHA